MYRAVSALPVLIDCDPGVDDAIALLLAFAMRGRLDIRAVTTVAGNVSAALTARNACIIREIAGRSDVPVHAGAERPLVRMPVEAGHFHGESGLGDLPLFVPEAGAEATDAVTAILAAADSGDLTLVATGPLTNVALALRADPGLAARLRRIVLMGGARREGGNITASAEYNIFADPHAAAEVFGCGAPIVVIGLDATHQVRATTARIDAVAALGTRRAGAAARLLRFSQGVERREVGGDAAPLHDPCTIAFLLAPELFTLVPCRIGIETGSPLTIGHSAVELRVDAADTATRWATGVDADGVWQLLLDGLAD